MRPGVGPGDALGELRSLLFGGETRRLDNVEIELRRLALAKLDRADLLAATADVLAGALRRAEVERHRELADALAPLIVAAIQAEIRNSKDSLVEALYPLMGRLVSAAVANAIRQLSDDLARRIDALVSARRWKWRLRALATGRPIGEVALADSQRARIVRILCLERHSGTLIAVWPEAETDGRSDLVSGMIAAITEFAATTFAREGGALRALDLGPQNVLLRSSATVIVAAECEGVLQPQDEQRVDAAFLDLIARHERAGGLASADLAPLADALAPAESAAPGPAGRWVLRIAGAAALAGLIWWIGGAALDWRLERRIEATLRDELARAPAAQAYPLRVDVDHAARSAVLTGLAPDPDLADRLLGPLRAAAAPYALRAQVDVVAGAAATDRRTRELDGRVVGFEARLARGESEAASRLDALRAELDRARGDSGAAGEAAARSLAGALSRLAALDAALAAARAEHEGGLEAARRDAETSRERGSDALRGDLAAARSVAAGEIAALRAALADESARGRAAIAEFERRQAQATADLAAVRAGLDAEIAALRSEADRLRRAAEAAAAEAGRPLARLRESVGRAAIFFARSSELSDRAAAAATIERIAALAREAGVPLRVVGHSDDSGSPDINLRLSRERAELVARLLTEKGVPPHHIVTASRRANAPISDVATAASSPNRRVTFELLLDQEPLQ